MYSGKGTPLASPVDHDDLEQLLERFPDTPQEYIDLIKIHDGITFIKEKSDEVTDEGLILSVYSAINALFIMTEWHPELMEDIPGCFFFASDGGDYGYLFGKHDGRGGIYRIGLSSPFWEHADYLGDSIYDILRKY